MTLFEPGPAGTQLIGELDLRDYAVGQDIELALGKSATVFSQCAAVKRVEDADKPRRWVKMQAQISNSNAAPIKARILLGNAGEVDIKWRQRTTELKDGEVVMAVEVPANSAASFEWKMRRPKGY